MSSHPHPKIVAPTSLLLLDLVQAHSRHSSHARSRWLVPRSLRPSRAPRRRADEQQFAPPVSALRFVDRTGEASVDLPDVVELELEPVQVPQPDGERHVVPSVKAPRPAKAPRPTKAPRPEPSDPVNAWLLAHLGGGLWFFGALVASAAALIVSLPAAVRTAAESALASQASIFASTGELAGAVAASSPLAWLQIGGYAQLTLAFARWDASVLAAREAMVFFTLVSVVVLWLLARRSSLSAPASAAATLIFVVSPLALQIHGVVSVETVGLPWALGALLLAMSRRAQVSAFIASAVLFTIAVLTAPALVIVAPLALSLMVQSTTRGRRSVPLVAGGTAIAAGIVAAVFVLSAIGLPLQIGATTGIAQPFDAVLLVVGIGAGIASLFVARVRVWAVFLLLIAGAIAALVWLGDGIPTVLLALALPLAALTIAGAADAAVAVIRRKGEVRFGATALLAFIAAGALLAAPLWSMQIASLVGDTQPDARGAARAWLIDNVDRSQQLVVDEAMGADLIAAGWADEDVSTYAAGSAVPERWVDADYVVTIGATVVDDMSFTVATFADGEGTVAVRRVEPAGRDAALSAEIVASVSRLRIGNEVLQNPNLGLGDAAREQLAAGRVDERIVLLLGALAADGEVGVAGFVPIDGETGQALRTVALTGLQGDALARDGATTSRADRLIQALDGEFAPEDAYADGDRLILRYTLTHDPLPR